MEPQPVSGTREGDPLQTKYYCQVNNSQNMNVVMELQAAKQEVVYRLPLRYVLVIDVSGSMKELVGVGRRSLLQRVQLFAELAVRKMNERDFLAIVTFSGHCVNELPMTRMTPANKQMARNIVKRLYLKDETNLESGLIGALEVIKSAPTCRSSRDCIILFTDGEANAGEIDAKKLIEKYRKVQSNMKRKSCIPVSAFTIGEYHPDMLIEISRQLGSESFYWLNDEEDFEADMLIPFFLREITNITDVDIKIESTANTYFDFLDRKAPHLTAIENHNVKIKKKKKKRPTKLSFFIHSLPDDNVKNLTFQLALPEMHRQNLDGKKVVDITIHYLDTNMERRTIQDYILLSTKSLMVLRNQDLSTSTNVVSLSATLREVSAFIVMGNQPGTSWREAEEVIIKVAEQKCKLASVTSIANAKLHTDDNAAQAHECFREAFQEINQIRNRTETLLPIGGESASRATRLWDEWTKRVSHANDVVATSNTRNYSKLSSMESSICTESPTSGGIFRDNQPFMSDIIEEKLVEEKKNLEVARRLQSGPEITFNTVKQRVSRAIKAGDLDTMEKCSQDLRALQLFDSEVEEDFLKYVELEIEHRSQLDRLKKNLEASLADEDVPSTENIVADIKDLRSNADLTFTSDDTKSLQRAANALAIYRRKRGLRAEIASIMPALKLPIVPGNMEKISNAIETLVGLRNQAKDYKDVFMQRDATVLNMAIVNVGEAKKQMDIMNLKMKDLIPTLTLQKHPSNFEAIEIAIVEMEHVQKKAEEYVGLFTEREKLILKTACDNRDSLAEERKRLDERIQYIIPTLELPMLPRNYAMLREAVEEMTTLRRTAIEFKDLFLPDHEAILNQTSANVALLMTKREELIEKIAKHNLDARLPKLPTNLDRIKTAVAMMSEARDEAKGFDNVFTEEHVQLLQSSLVSMKILESEKRDILKEESECVAQLQLPMLANYYRQICQGVDTMKRITPELKGFGLYKDEYDSLLKKAIFNRDVLEDKKSEISKDLEKLKPHIKVNLVPENLRSLREVVEKMKTLKDSSRGFENVFTTKNESDLFEATANLEHLNNKVEKTNEARQRLEEAVAKRNFLRLKHAVKKANRAPFITKGEMKEPRRLLSFLDPNERRSALKYAMEQEDVEEIEEALLEMREARVDDDSLENKATEIMKKLRKQKKREEKERRRIEREKARRQRRMVKIEGNLIAAIESREVETLEQALLDFENCEFCESEITSANDGRELLEHLKVDLLRNRLVDAVKIRDIGAIYSALMDANHGGFVEQMRKEYEVAETLLLYLLEMMRLREEITKMTRSSLSEVHGYPSPPEAIKKIMKAIYVILGESPKELKEWTKIQALMGRLDRNSITKRVGRFRIRDLSSDTAQTADKFLKNLELEEVEGVSKVAATLYAWAKYVVKEIAHLREEAVRKERAREEAEKEENYEKYDNEEFEADEEKSTHSSTEVDENGPADEIAIVTDSFTNDATTADPRKNVIDQETTNNKPTFVISDPLE